MNVDRSLKTGAVRRDARDWDRSKRRDFQNDALIALTARRHGAVVVTANREEYELLSQEIGVSILPA